MRLRGAPFAPISGEETEPLFSARGGGGDDGGGAMARSPGEGLRSRKILGQLVSLLVTGTGFASSELSRRRINVPTSQSLLNYLLFGVVYGSILLLYRRKPLQPHSHSTSAAARPRAPSLPRHWPPTSNAADEELASSCRRARASRSFCATWRRRLR